MKRSILSTALFVLGAILASVLSAGCGGQGVDFNTWAATYSGSGALDNSKVGDLALTSDAQGLVSGTLTVTGADGTDTNFKFTAGAYNVSGSITSTSGGFEVTGSVPSNGTFFVRGQFPTDSSSKAYKVITATSSTFITSQTYDGNLTRN